MKIGVCADVYGKCYGEQRFERMAADGFEYASVMITKDMLDAPEAALARCTREAEMATAAGVGIIRAEVLSDRFPFLHAETEEIRCELLAKLTCAIDMAKVMGCEQLILHPIIPFGFDDSFESDQSVQINDEFFLQLLAKAEERGVTLCVCTPSIRKFPLRTPEQLVALTERLGGRLKTCLDVGGEARVGRDPVEGIRQLGGTLASLRIRDNRGRSNEDLVPGLGTVNWNAVLAALTEIGYDGPFILNVSLDELFVNAVPEIRTRMIYQIAKSITEIN